MNLTKKISVLPQIVAREVGNEAVLLDLESGTYFGLDPVGARMWQLMGEGKTLAEVCDAMIEEYDVARETLEFDIVKLAGELATKKLIRME